MDETRKEATAAFDFFVETHGVKCEKAVGKLVKDRDELLAFYDYPAKHWKHKPSRKRLRRGPQSHPENQRLPQSQNRLGPSG